MIQKRQSIIVLGANASLRIRNGALDMEHGPRAKLVSARIDIDEPKPCAILFDGRGENISGEAIRFCARYAINIILPNGPGRAILFTESALEATDGEMLRDVGPAVIRAQCAADPIAIAREIAQRKIAADAAGLGPRVTARDLSTIARCEAKLVSARRVAEIIVVEAKAASVYWRSHRDLGLIERKGGNLPRSWRRFANRGRGAEFLGNKHASHPGREPVSSNASVAHGPIVKRLSRKEPHRRRVSPR
jgi:CRISPR/Cas system-associated endonuclease Cas1